MLVLGLDIATSSGVCLMDTAQPPHEWRCFAIEAEGHNAEEKAGDLAMALNLQLAKHCPAFAAIEMPQRSVQRFRKKGADIAGEKDELTINPAALQLSAMAGAAVAVLDLAGVAWGLIHPVTWRKAYFGSGYKPRVGWKDSAMEFAKMQKIVLPPTVRAARDAAEAIGIARAWQKCSFVPDRHQQTFINLRTGREAA